MENSTSRYNSVHPRYRLRKGINFIMLAGTGLCTLLAITPLIWILGYVVVKGAPSLSIGFFTQLPTPAGVPGGGLANALMGSAITVGLGLLIAAPTGILAALFMSANPRSQISYVLRFSTDVISGVPSIVMGIFAYTLIVLPQKHFSAFSGGIVLSFIMVPTIVRTVEGVVYLSASDADMIESKILALFARRYLEERDIVDVFLFQDRLAADAGGRVSRKLGQLHLTRACVSETLRQIAADRDYHVRNLEGIVKDQIDPPAAANLRAAGGTATPYFTRRVISTLTRHRGTPAALASSVDVNNTLPSLACVWNRFCHSRVFIGYVPPSRRARRLVRSSMT